VTRPELAFRPALILLAAATCCAAGESPPPPSAPPSAPPTAAVPLLPGDPGEPGEPGEPGSFANPDIVLVRRAYLPMLFSMLLPIFGSPLFIDVLARCIFE
jgi:hypothetical protein